MPQHDTFGSTGTSGVFPSKTHRLRPSIDRVPLLGLACMVLAAACGQASSTSGERDTQQPAVVDGNKVAHSGTRLKALGYTLGDSSVFWSFLDTQRGFECRFAGEGETYHCFPTATLDVVYMDEACSDAGTWDYFEPGQWVSARIDGWADFDQEPGQPASPRQTYEVAEVAVADSSTVTLYRRGANGSCEAGAYPNSHEVPAVRRLIAKDASELVRAQPHRVALREGVDLVRLVAEDGAAANIGVTTTEGRYCLVLDDGRCVPTPVLDMSWVADPEGASYNAACTLYTELFRQGSTPFPQGTVYYVEGGTSPVFEVTMLDTKTCEAISTPIVVEPNNTLAIRLEGEVDSLPELMRATNPDAVAQIWGHLDKTGEQVLIAALDSGCRAERTVDGALKCVGSDPDRPALSEVDY